MQELTRIEISKSALEHNIKAFKQHIGDDVILAPAVKANAYGHGLVGAAQVFLDAGADYLCVNAPFEAKVLREAGIKAPILIIGYTPLADLTEMIDLDVELLVYNLETLEKIVEIGKEVKVHLKIETGNNRQGILYEDLPQFIDLIKNNDFITLNGVSTHFANIEDTEDQEYARYQLENFNKAITLIEEQGLSPKFKHCANSAATMILPEAHFNFVRTGVSNYGMWPSAETQRSMNGIDEGFTLKPAMTWKTTVAQVKQVKKGEKIGYGCTYEMPEDGQIAILPVGYYDNYSRLHSNNGAALINGKRAPIAGRICMNIMMVNVTGIDVSLEDEAILLGKQGDEEITAEEIAEWTQTINYEVTTRINERIPRIFI